MADEFLQIYTNAAIYINGSILTEENDISIDRNANSQSIDTVGAGYAGEVLGPLSLELMITNAVPSTGFEFYPERFMGVGQELQFSIAAADKILTFRGFILSDNFSHAVNSSSKLSFKAKGQFSNWN